MSTPQAGMNVSRTRARMEEDGLTTDRLPVLGMRPGKSNVTTELVDPRFDVAPFTVELLVIGATILKGSCAHGVTPVHQNLSFWNRRWSSLRPHATCSLLCSHGTGP